MESIHFKEDTAKPENRTNLALLSVLQIDEIRTYFVRVLHLPPESLVYPCPNLETEEFATSQRPDFVVRGRGQEAIAYIEVELGPENSAQITHYRSLTNRDVLSIVGKASYNPSDLSLEAIYKYAAVRPAEVRTHAADCLSGVVLSTGQVLRDRRQLQVFEHTSRPLRQDATEPTCATDPVSFWRGKHIPGWGSGNSRADQIGHGGRERVLASGLFDRDRIGRLQPDESFGGS